MPDISMCSGEVFGTICPQRDECYRFKATPSQYRQCYFSVAPFVDSKTETCKQFMPIYARRPWMDDIGDDL
jgi:hypothetical protein